ncbi:MAG: hypothetical protein IKM00_02605, partial [Clostridia bacterium]|nr:hypothetical protein [Clostridia bacterium]
RFTAFYTIGNCVKRLRRRTRNKIRTNCYTAATISGDSPIASSIAFQENPDKNLPHLNRICDIL